MYGVRPRASTQVPHQRCGPSRTSEWVRRCPHSSAPRKRPPPKRAGHASWPKDAGWAGSRFGAERSPAGGSRSEPARHASSGSHWSGSRRRVSTERSRTGRYRTVPATDPKPSRLNRVPPRAAHGSRLSRAEGGHGGQLQTGAASRPTSLPDGPLHGSGPQAHCTQAQHPRRSLQGRSLHGRSDPIGGSRHRSWRHRPLGRVSISRLPAARRPGTAPRRVAVARRATSPTHSAALRCTAPNAARNVSGYGDTP